MRCCCGLPHDMTGLSMPLWSASQTGHHGCDRGVGCLMGQLTHSMGHLGHLMFNSWRVFCISINQDKEDGHPRKMAGRSLGKTSHRLLNRCSTAPFWWRPWAWPAWRLRNSSVARPGRVRRWTMIVSCVALLRTVRKRQHLRPWDAKRCWTSGKLWILWMLRFWIMVNSPNLMV